MDEDGNTIPEETRRWFIGFTCNSNAETAHSLLHWKHALLEWVEVELERMGYFTPEQLASRAKLTPKAKCKLVDEIMAQWVSERKVRALYDDFRENIEKARVKKTNGRHQRGR